MRAVVFKGPRSIEVEDRPRPTLQLPTDAIVQVAAAGVCGTELHAYRGEMNSPPGYIMGHEFSGTIVELGLQVTGFEVGDTVVATFTQQCGTCFYCTAGHSSMCEETITFGCPRLDGGQAEYVRVPYANQVLFRKPDDVPDEVLVLMADIFPTGYHGVNQYALRRTPEQLATDTVVVLGCGPVGLCAVLAAKAMGIANLIAVDLVPDRLETAARFGATAIPLTDADTVVAAVRAATGGRGADGVVEVVGSEGALRMAFDLVRPAGVLLLVGYQHGKIPILGLECYVKCANMLFGRCPVKHVFNDALEVFRKVAAEAATLVDTVVPLDDAPRVFALFEQHKVRKVVLKP